MKNEIHERMEVAEALAAKLVQSVNQSNQKLNACLANLEDGNNKRKQSSLVNFLLIILDMFSGLCFAVQ